MVFISKLLYYLHIKIFYFLFLLLLLSFLMCTCEQQTYTSSEHFHLEEGETMLARGNEFFLIKKNLKKFKKLQKKSFSRKVFRNLTKWILTCLFKKGGLLSILVQNSPKVTKKVQVFRKVARSCSLTKKLLKILKVAKKLPSRSWKDLP